MASQVFALLPCSHNINGCLLHAPLCTYNFSLVYTALMHAALFRWLPPTLLGLSFILAAINSRVVLPPVQLTQWGIYNGTLLLLCSDIDTEQYYYKYV